MEPRDLIEPAAVAVAVLVAAAAVWLVRFEPDPAPVGEGSVASEAPVLPWAPVEDARPPPATARALAFSPDGRRLAFERAGDGAVSVWVGVPEAPERAERVVVPGGSADQTGEPAWLPGASCSSRAARPPAPRPAGTSSTAARLVAARFARRSPVAGRGRDAPGLRRASRRMDLGPGHRRGDEPDALRGDRGDARVRARG